MYTLANFEAIGPVSIKPPPVMEEYQIPPGCKMNTESVIMEPLMRGRPGREPSKKPRSWYILGISIFSYIFAAGPF